MTIESTTTITGLNPSLPGGTDEIKEGDDHIRLLKSVLQADALSKSLMTQQNVLGPVLFNQSVSVTGDLTVAGSIAGNVTFSGVPTLWNPAPELRFSEADQTDPNGQFRFLGNGGQFYFQRAANAGWASNELIWGYIFGAFQFSKDVIFTAGARIENTTPDLRFADTDLADPAGRFRFFGEGDTFSLQRAVTANWGATSTIWSYTGGSTDVLTVYKAIVLSGNSLTVTHTAPAFYLTESDQIDPAGRFRFYTSGNIFSFQRATSAAWGSATSIWSYDGTALALSIGSSTTFTTTTTIESTTPTLRFLETDATSPAGQYSFQGASTGDFFFHRYTAANWGSGSIIWNYDTATASFNTVPLTKLATTGGVVEIGNTSGAMIKFMRTTSAFYNYLQVPDATILRVQNATGTAWATVSSASGWAAGSDARMKRDIEDIHYGLDTVMALRPVQFDWLADGRHDIGLIAQEVEPIIPEIVEIWEADPDIEGQIDTYALRKDALTVVLVKAMQELTARVAALEGT